METTCTRFHLREMTSLRKYANWAQNCFASALSMMKLDTTLKQGCHVRRPRLGLMSCAICDYIRRDVECNMGPCAVRCRLRIDILWKLMSLQFEVVYDVMLHMVVSSGDLVHAMTWSLVSMRPCVTLHEGECHVWPLRARSCVSLCS